MTLPSASVTMSVKGWGALNALPSVALGKLEIVTPAGIPERVTVVLVELALRVKVTVPCESALPPALAASYMTIVNVSLPGGESGPVMLQPALQLPAGTFVVAVVVKPAGGAEPLTEVNVIVTERVEGETYCGCRARDAALADGAGTVIVKLGASIDPTAALAGVEAGLLLPPQPQRPRRNARSSRLTGASRATESQFPAQVNSGLGSVLGLERG